MTTLLELPEELATRLNAFATARGLSTPDALAELLAYRESQTDALIDDEDDSFVTPDLIEEVNAALAEHDAGDPGVSYEQARAEILGRWSRK